MIKNCLRYHCSVVTCYVYRCQVKEQLLHNDNVYSCWILDSAFTIMSNNTALSLRQVTMDSTHRLHRRGGYGSGNQLQQAENRTVVTILHYRSTTNLKRCNDIHT